MRDTFIRNINTKHMKLLIAICASVCGLALHGNAQSTVKHASIDTVKVVLENEKMKVTEYVSSSGKDVCGKGKHSHPAHLTILLSDVSVLLTTAEGEVKNLSVPSGASFWSEKETHVVRNKEKGARVLLVEVK
jgi:hypothetical protein